MHKLIWIGLCTTAFLYVSCSKEAYQSQETVNLLSYYPAPSQSCIEPSRIIYHNTLDPAPLTKNQLDELSKFVCDTKPNNVWFVRVLYNRQKILRAEIFFLPDTSSSRIMKGKSAYYDSQFLLFPKAHLDEQKANYYLKSLRPEYYEYVQVLPEFYSPVPGDIPFNDYLLPFSVSGDFSDQEIIEIVDFMRSIPTLKRDSKEGRLVYPEKINSQLPIRFIERKNGQIEVMTGTLEGPESGSGECLMIKKSDGGYELISIGMWMS